jgi:murein DD-endopeptidase MepM/ murein hydrolase activator NlpD
LIVSTAATMLVVAAGANAGVGGGITTPPPPTVDSVRCLQRCLDARTVSETGTAELGGSNLSEVTGVRLKGVDGKLTVEPKKAKASSVRFEVPRGARSGRPVVLDGLGNKVRSKQKLTVVDEDRIDKVEGFEVSTARATPAKSYFDGKRRSQINYLFEAEGPTDIRIDVLKGKRLVDTIVQRDQDPFATHSKTWDGLDEHGKVGPSGKYRFELSQLSGGARSDAGFRYYNHKFPLQGRHDYGDGLGAGRGHMGQDLFARCNNDVRAARGGRVQTSSHQSSAGYYVVIDGRKTGVDYFYAHLSRKGRPKEGSQVKTGERIGFNDDTGNASGCHVHFEIWSAPGWYEGGKVLNPTKRLKRWDRWS